MTDAGAPTRIDNDRRKNSTDEDHVQSPKPSNANGSSPIVRLILCSLRRMVSKQVKLIFQVQEQRTTYDPRPCWNFVHLDALTVEICGRIQVRQVRSHRLKGNKQGENSPMTLKAVHSPKSSSTGIGTLTKSSFKVISSARA